VFSIAFLTMTFVAVWFYTFVPSCFVCHYFTWSATNVFHSGEPARTY
jgi:hypothetical protein